MSESTLLTKFSTLFCGNTNFYVKHKAPFTEGENGKRKASWCGFNKDKSTGEFVPVTLDTYRGHLNGEDGLALSPLTDYGSEHNVCFFSVIDIDVYDADYKTLVQRLYKSGFKFAAFLSKSGGLHLYFFFSVPEKANVVIDTMARIVETFALDRLYVNAKNKSKVEIFPKQAAIVPGESQANCVMLPYYNVVEEGGPCRQKMLTVEGKLAGIEKAIAYIEASFTSTKEIHKTLDGLPYADAPYCVQSILLSGALGENSGRNDFLFSAAVYLKKKLGENFYDDLVEMNEYLESPLEIKDLKSIHKSVSEKEFHPKCKTSPCSDYCDKKLCAKREYGIGKDKQNHFTGADSWGMISRVLAEEPYYLWDVRVKPEDEYKTIRIDGEADLMNQFVVQRACIRALDWSPFHVKDNDWIQIVNDAMVGIQDRLVEVKKETDTTDQSALRGLFARYLTHKLVKHAKPYMVQIGHVFKQEDTYYFSHDGLKDFLRIQKFVLGRTNLRETLLSYGCSEGEIEYTTTAGVTKKILCWKKPVDDALKSLDEFYEDIYDGDKDILSAAKITKAEEDKNDAGEGREEPLF